MLGDKQRLGHGDLHAGLAACHQALPLRLMHVVRLDLEQHFFVDGQGVAIGQRRQGGGIRRIVIAAADFVVRPGDS